MANPKMRLLECVRRGFWFLATGGIGFLLYLIISATMHYFMHVGPVPSAIAGTLISILPTFWMQRRVTFRSNRSQRQALPRYTLLQVGNAALIGGLTAIGSRMGATAGVVFFFAGAAGALISYFIQSRFIFTSV